MYPDSCIPRNYTGYGDNECFSNCPVNCGINDMPCSGGTDPTTANYIFQYGLKYYKFLQEQFNRYTLVIHSLINCLITNKNLLSVEATF